MHCCALVSPFQEVGEPLRGRRKAERASIRWHADVSLAVAHALALLCAHALHWLRMRGEHRQHSIRTGPAGTAIGTGVHTTVFWAVMQVPLDILTSTDAEVSNRMHT